MSTCEEFQSRIPDMDELRHEVLGQLERHTETCEGCRTKLDEYRSLMRELRALSTPPHVEGERLTRFAIHRAAPTEPDFDQVRLSGEEIQQIEVHVSECPRCRFAVESIMVQYEQMDEFLTEAGVPPCSIPIEKPSIWVAARIDFPRIWDAAKQAFTLPLSYPTAGVALGTLAVLVWISPLLRDPYDRLAVIEATKIEIEVRNSGSALQRGISLMNDGRYSEAIPLLEEYRGGASNERLHDYSHYLSGLAWVYEAKTEYFGRVLNYNEARLDRAIEHLQIVTESSPGGRVLEDAYWLLGKAYLMKQERELALQAFREVGQLDGRRAGDAQEMVQAIGAVDD